MLSFAIFTLGWAALILFACYLLIAFHEVLGEFVGEALGGLVCFLAAAGVLVWGISFVARRWQSIGCQQACRTPAGVLMPALASGMDLHRAC